MFGTKIIRFCSRGNKDIESISYPSMYFYKTFLAPRLLTWRQGLFELLGLLLVCDDQRVQVPAAAHLELNIILVLLDLYS